MGEELFIKILVLTGLLISFSFSTNVQIRPSEARVFSKFKKNLLDFSPVSYKSYLLLILTPTAFLE